MDNAQEAVEKWIYNVKTKKLKRCGYSHADATKSTAEWDQCVRVIIFRDKKAVYIRFFAPKWDGLSVPTPEDVEEAFRRADEATEELLRTSVIRGSWPIHYWKIGGSITHADIKS